VKLSPTDELGTVHGDLKAYDYLIDKQSFSTSHDTKAMFTLKSEGQSNHLMKMWIKGSENQQIFSVMAPESDGISRGTAPAEMMGHKIPTLVLRRNEEAWNSPFTVILNPYIEGENQIISNVDFLESDSRTGIQMIKVEHSDGITEDLIIATTSENDILEKDELYFQGLLAIQRESENQLEFIFASGLRRYSHSGWEISSRTENVTLSIERSEAGFTLQNDKPVSIRVPKDLNPAYVEIYEEGKLIGKRVGVVSERSNQVEFKFEKPFDKVIMVLGK